MSTANPSRPSRAPAYRCCGVGAPGCRRLARLGRSAPAVADGCGSVTERRGEHPRVAPVVLRARWREAVPEAVELLRVDPDARRLARRQPGPSREPPPRGGSRPEARRHQGGAPVLSPAEARKLLKTIDTGALDRLRRGCRLEEPKAALFQSMDPAGRRLTGRAPRRVARGGPGRALELLTRRFDVRAVDRVRLPAPAVAVVGQPGRAGRR